MVELVRLLLLQTSGFIRPLTLQAKLFSKKSVRSELDDEISSPPHHHPILTDDDVLVPQLCEMDKGE